MAADIEPRPRDPTTRWSAPSALCGIGNGVDDVAVGDVRCRRYAGLASAPHSRLGDVLGPVPHLDLEDGGPGAAAPSGPWAPNRQDVESGVCLQRHVDCDIEGFVSGLGAVGGDQNIVHCLPPFVSRAAPEKFSLYSARPVLRERLRGELG